MREAIRGSSRSGRDWRRDRVDIVGERRTCVSPCSKSLVTLSSVELIRASTPNGTPSRVVCTCANTALSNGIAALPVRSSKAMNPTPRASAVASTPSAVTSSAIEVERVGRAVWSHAHDCMHARSTVSDSSAVVGERRIQSAAISCNQPQSDAIRRNWPQSDAIRRNQTQSSGAISEVPSPRCHLRGAISEVQSPRCDLAPAIVEERLISAGRRVGESPRSRSRTPPPPPPTPLAGDTSPPSPPRRHKPPRSPPPPPPAPSSSKSGGGRGAGPLTNHQLSELAPSWAAPCWAARARGSSMRFVKFVTRFAEPSCST